ncbi:MAG: hypothetical protein H6591_14375, partial [Flavobacteriales bacterium]|nr:hypothetical protein [Flavobacteriales bacterium]
MSGLLGVALFLFGIGAKAQVDVTATAGTLSQSYTTLGAAFTAINAGTHQGVITIGISGNTTESATASLNSGAVAPASWTSMSIAPTGGARVITGNIVGAIVKLNGADNVTIDGRIAGSGRNLTISNSNTSGSTAAIWLASVAAGNGCTGNTIRNLEIACGATQNTSTNSTFGIIMCGTSISTTTNGVDNDNNTFQENRIIRCRYGITTRGTTTNLNESPQVLNNIVGPTAFGADEIGKVGIFMQADNNAIVRGNTVQFVGGDFANTSGGADRVGIGIGQESWSTAPSTLTSTNYTVDRNVIHDVVEERTFSAVGLLLGTTNGGSATNNVVCSNMIYNVRANGTSGDQTVGLGISGGHSDQVVYNSIRLSGDVDPNPSASATTNYGSGIRIANTNGTTHLNLTLKNNIVYMDLSSSSTSAVRYYAISGPANSYAFGTGGENNNDLYYNPSNPQCLTGGLGTSSGNTLTTQFTTLANWQGAYTVAQDANSIQVDPGFVSSTDLHINSGSTAVNNLGTPVGCTTDFDGDTRSGSTPDIGADEYAPVTCTGTPNVPTAAFTGGASTCNGSTKGMSATGATVGAGISYQWEVSTIGGGLGFSNVVGGTGATSTSYTSGSLSTGTYYFRLRTNCSFTTPPADVSYSNEILLTVYAIPTASATNNGPACAGGTVDLDGTTDIGTSYTWSGPNGFASTSEDPSVSPIVAASAGIYTFTASANGCTSTPATTTVSVNPLIYSSGATASPTTICSGSTSNLSIVAGTTSAYTVSSATFGLLSGTGTTAVTGDDAAGTAITMPFAFDYFGTAYTSVIPYSNGWIQLGTSSGSTSSYSVTIPTAGAPETIIAGLKDDLNVTGGGTCTYFTVGSSPNRVFVVYWNGVKFYNSASNNGNATFQIQLFEKDMHIEVHIADATDPVASAKTVGIEDQTGTVGYTPTGRNNVTFSVAPGTPEAWAFYPSGGTLSYSWSPSGDVVSPGSASTATNALFASTPFTVIVSDGTCSISSNVTVNVNAAITSASITGTVEYCAGGSTTLTAVPADGVPTYTYLWSPNGETTASIVVSAPGNYSCQVGDACSGSVNTGTATVIEKPVPTATAGSNSPVCTGDAINLSGATDIGTAFSWTGPGGYTSSSQNPTIGSAALTDAGTYTFTASLNGCTSLPSNTSVSVNPSPTNVTANASATTVCAGSQVDLTSSADPVNVTVLSQNFNSAPAGWTTVNNSTGGTPANTAWTLRPNAYNTGGTWGAVLSSNDASQFYLSNSDAGGSGISGTTFLISPVIDLSSYSAVSLGFWHYYRDLGTNDTARVQISTNGGASWTDVQVFTATTGLPATFANATINLNAYAGQSNVTLRFRYRFGWDYGWAVDNVTVTAAQNLSYSWVSAPVYYTSNVQNPTGVTVASVPTTFTVTASTGLCSTDANVVVNADLTDTDGDLIPDCEDSCPTLAGEIGDACNDGNPNTVLDVIDGTCTCVGQACTTDLDIIFQPDGVSDIGWELRQQGTDILVQSGNGVYPASPGYSLATCLPDGCFYLVVTDDGGDGIT